MIPWPIKPAGKIKPGADSTRTGGDKLVFFVATNQVWKIGWLAHFLLMYKQPPLFFIGIRIQIISCFGHYYH